MEERWWVDQMVEFTVKDIWGATITLSDDPEIGVIIGVRRAHPDPNPGSEVILLTEPDLDLIAKAIARYKQMRPFGTEHPRETGHAISQREATPLDVGQ